MQAETTSTGKKWENQRGAALVTVVLIGFLLLVASASLLLTTSLFAGTVSDSISEDQAYYAAESGLQSALNALRGNVAPRQTMGSPAADTISYRKAVDTATSNLSTDLSSSARLSRWLNYNYDPTGGTNPDRATMGAVGYSPLNGMAYSITVEDPDNTGVVTYSSVGQINEGGNASITFGSGLNMAVITYEGNSPTTVNVLPQPASVSFGKFRILAIGSTTIPDTRFAIRVTATAPYPGSCVMRGTIKGGIITPNSSAVSIQFDSPKFLLQGSDLTLSSQTIPLKAPNAGGVTEITGTISAPEPQRLLLRSIGYGPRGSRKTLEMIVQKNPFGPLTAPSAITLVGSSDRFELTTGNSNNVAYLGSDDCPSTRVVPAVGVTNPANLNEVRNTVGDKPILTGNAATTFTRNAVFQDVSFELPDWLESPAALDSTVRVLREIAKSTGNYYPVGTAPTSIGSNTNGTGVTFIEGDVELSRAGGGVLVVTGNLTFNGGFDFKGIVIVTGSMGLVRDGGGNGKVEGLVVVAPYDPNKLSDGFISPKFNTNGGGTSTVQYNSCAAESAFNSVSNVALGIVEK